MNTTIDIYDQDVAKAELQLAEAEKSLRRAARAGQKLDSFAEVEQLAQKSLDAAKGRRDRARILDRMAAEEDRKGGVAKKAHDDKAKKNAAAIKREVETLDAAARKAAEAAIAAVKASRDAADAVRAYSAAVKASAGRLAMMGLPLADEWNQYRTGGTVGGHKSVVQDGDAVFATVTALEVQALLRWVSLKADGQRTPGGVPRGLGAPIVSRLTS